MAKICIDARPGVMARGTGIGNYTYQLVHYLVRLAPQHIYYFLWPDDGTPPWRLPVACTYKPMTRKRDDEAVELPPWLAREGIELFHAPDNGLHAFWPDTVRTVVTIHDLIPFVMPETVRRSYKQSFLDIVPEIARKSHAIITVSQTTKVDIMAILNIGPEKIHVIYPAPEDMFTPNPRWRGKAYLQASYGIGAPYILYSGGLNPRKNVKELIYAFAKARTYWKEGPLLVIPGKISDSNWDLTTLCKALSLEADVVFTGFVPMEDLVTLYQEAQLFVYPSLYEGFGLPPLEAMACGVPVLSSPVPSVTEVAANAALIFNPEDTTALTAHLDRGLKDQGLRSALVESGRQVVASLNWESTAKQTLAVYHRVLGLQTAGEIH